MAVSANVVGGPPRSGDAALPAGETADVVVNDAATNTQPTALRLRHRTTGTPATGFGVAIEMAGEDAGGADQDIAIIRARLQPATAGSETGQFRVGVVASGGALPSTTDDQFAVTGSAITCRNSLSTTNVTADTLFLYRRTSGTAAAGIGMGINVVVESAGGNDCFGFFHRHVLTTATDAAEVGEYRLAVVNGGSVQAEGSEFFRVSGTGSIVAGGGAIATNATDGFLYVPTCAGTPTGTPTAKTGYAPIVINTTNNKLYFYSGAWRDAGP